MYCCDMEATNRPRDFGWLTCTRAKGQEDIFEVTVKCQRGGVESTFLKE